MSTGTSWQGPKTMGTAVGARGPTMLQQWDMAWGWTRPSHSSLRRGQDWLHDWHLLMHQQHRHCPGSTAKRMWRSRMERWADTHRGPDVPLRGQLDSCAQGKAWYGDERRMCTASYSMQ
jgi:hypothetical protein